MSSPSAVAKVKGCARKFALDLFDTYVQSKEAELGDEIHEQADDYQKFGKAPDLTRTAGLVLEAGLPYMPKPRTGNAEGKVRWAFRGLTHNFRMDLNGFVHDLPMALPEADPNMPYVLDYKSQKDKGGREKDQQLWGKAAFLADEEAILYALKRMADTGSRVVYMRWLYLRAPNAEGKLRPKARPSDVILGWDEVLDAYERTYAPYARVVDGIYSARDKRHLTVLSAMSLPPNPFQCTRYGIKYPCSHLAKCQLSPELVMVTTSKEENYVMQLQGNDLFAAMQQAMGQTAPAVQPAPAPAPVVNPNAFAPVTQTFPVFTMPAQLTTPALPVPNAVIPSTTMPSSPAFVNPPEAPHVPQVTSISPALQTMVQEQNHKEAPELAMDSDEALGFAVRVLVNFVCAALKR